MGNRCVITTSDVTKDNQDEKLGLYLHWCGSRRDVENILRECKKRKIRNPGYDYEYFWARFCQIACDYCGKEKNTGVGINMVSRLDVENFGNGVYYIDNDLDIVRQTDGSELTVRVRSTEKNND